MGGVQITTQTKSQIKTITRWWKTMVVVVAASVFRQGGTRQQSYVIFASPRQQFCSAVTRKDTVFLCMTCDVKLHGHTKHERVWMCDVCEQAPACVTCKADAATLCVTCDREIHSANPFARRHERIPVVPFYDSAEAVVSSTAGSLLDAVSGTDLKENGDSWGTHPVVMKPIDVDLFTVGDPFFDFGFAIPTDIVRYEPQFCDSFSDCVVPIQTKAATTSSSPPSQPPPPPQIVDHNSPYENDFTRSVSNSYNRSICQSHSVSSSSMNAGVVPEDNSIMPPVNGGVMNYGEKSKRFSAIDREARVLRYREKRKNRKFEKKIRYASRKAYAEMRPRIKGRFVKRTELTAELDVDRWFFTAESNNGYVAEVPYDIVPSF